MALVSNIVVDLANDSATLIITKSGNPVETLTFSSNQVTFSSRPNINITGTEFLDLVSQINIFQTALLANFNANIFSFASFNSVNCTEAHDIPTDKWNLVCIYGATPRVLNYSGNGSNNTVDLLNRANSKTIYFS